MAHNEKALMRGIRKAAAEFTILCLKDDLAALRAELAAMTKERDEALSAAADVEADLLYEVERFAEEAILPVERERAHLAGAAEERARVVADLRAHADRIDVLVGKMREDRDHTGVAAMAFRMKADEYELRGEHIAKEPTP